MPISARSAWGRHPGSSSLMWSLNKPRSAPVVQTTVRIYHAPILIIFFQFQSPKWSSKVSRLEPGPISLVLCAAGLILAQPRSGASPSVLPTPFVRLNENPRLHASTCAGRWNLGTRKRTCLMLVDKASSGGKIFILSPSFLCHWHAMSYEMMRQINAVATRLLTNM
jgi:hypothetical protein